MLGARDRRLRRAPVQRRVRGVVGKGGMLLRRRGGALGDGADALHDVEGFEVLLDGPEQVRAAVAHRDAVAVAEDVVDDGHHAVAPRQVRRAVELRQQQQHRVVLLVRGAVPRPRVERRERVQRGPDLERRHGRREQHVAEAVLRVGARVPRGLRQVAVQQHRVAARHEGRRDEPGVALDGHAGVEVVQVPLLDVALLGLDTGAQVVQGDCFSVDLYAAPEDESVHLVALVADEGQRGVGPTGDGGRLVLPFGSAELEDVVVDVEGEGDVEVVGADGGVRALCFGGFEVQEADLVPEEGADVALEGGEGVCRRVREAVDANALGQTNERADDDRGGAGDLCSTQWYQVDGQSLKGADVGRLGPVCAYECSLGRFLQSQEQVFFCDAELRLGLQRRHGCSGSHAHGQHQCCARVWIRVANLDVHPEAFEQSFAKRDVQHVSKRTDSLDVAIQERFGLHSRR